MLDCEPVVVWLISTEVPDALKQVFIGREAWLSTAPLSQSGFNLGIYTREDGSCDLVRSIQDVRCGEGKLPGPPLYSGRCLNELDCKPQAIVGRLETSLNHEIDVETASDLSCV